MISNLSLSWILALAALACGLAIHIFLFRVFVPVDRFSVLNKIFTGVAGMQFIGGLTVLNFYPGLRVVPPTPTEIFFSAVVYFGFLFMAYILLYALMCRSITLRIHLELHRRQNLPVSLEQIQELYGTEQAFESRLSSLIRNNYIERSGELLILMPKGKVFGAIALIWKKFLRLGLGG